MRVPYKKSVIEKRTYVNKGCNLGNPYLLTVWLSNYPLINYLERNDISIEIGYIWILNGYRNVVQYECSYLIVPFQHLKNGLFAFSDLCSENAVLNLKGQFAFEKWNSFDCGPNIYVLQHGVSCVKSLKIKKGKINLLDLSQGLSCIKNFQKIFGCREGLSNYGSGIPVSLFKSKYSEFNLIISHLWFPD